MNTNYNARTINKIREKRCFPYSMYKTGIRSTGPMLDIPATKAMVYPAYFVTYHMAPINVLFHI